MPRISYFLPFVIVLFLLSGCATSKEARSYKKLIDGKWQLETISTEGIAGKIKVQLFNEQDLNCFLGSTWSFNERNSLGNYTISKNGNECAALNRNMRWSVYEAKDEPKLLQFKRLDNNLKVMDNGDGFRFTIIQSNNSSMQLKSSITFENKPAWVIYNFIKK